MTCIFNPALYPSSYPPVATSSPLPGDPVVPGVEEILDTLTYVQVQNRDTALQAAANRRIIGHQTIWNQNRLTGAVSLPISFAETGKASLPVPGVLGTVAYLSGGRSYESPLSDMMAFYLGNESVAAVGMVLSEIRQYMGTVGNDAYGYYFGGFSSLGVFTICDKLSFDKPSIARIGASLGVARFGGAGICNSVEGVVLGGADDNTAPVRLADRLPFSTEIAAPLGNKLVTPRTSPHNGTSNPTDGYIWGGANWSQMHLQSGRIFTVESYNFQSQNCTTLGGTLTASHLAHAAFGSPDIGYVAGGLGSTAPGFPVTDAISRLPYDTLTLSTLGDRLVEETICVDGTQSSAAGYTLGGETNGFATAARSNKVVFATETAYSLGTTLPGIYADRGAVSDYNPGR